MLSKLADRASSKTIVVASSLRVERSMGLTSFGVRDVPPYAPAALAGLVS
jgi:hypothetical protein